MTERIAKVGFINEEQKHALISIYNPALINAGSDWVQVAVSIDGAMALKAELNAFLVRRQREGTIS